jgi:SAM-dependent methyltransferase
VYAGTGRLCPVCGSQARRFAAFGQPRRIDARCVSCGALERHRLLWQYLTRRSGVFDRRTLRVLHVAPEPCLQPRLRRVWRSGYVTIDLFDPRTDARMDLLRLAFPNAAFDLIYCSHVLEHVADDRQALREFYRVLKPAGQAILLVPVSDNAETIDDPSITDPQERERLFGQEDHVRLYGRDFPDRLRDAGFAVQVFGVQDLARPSEAIRLGLGVAAGDIFVCRKSQN